MDNENESALKRLEAANTIFEPHELGRTRHLLFLLLWVGEILLVCYLAFRLYS